MYLLLVFCCFFPRRFAGDEVKNTMGMLNKSVKMRCNTSHWYTADIVTKVEWYDFVYNSDENPIEIFSSENNTEFQVNSGHPNFKKIEVESDYTLIITLLDMESDPGNYFCKVHYNNNKTHSHSYYLSISAVPHCQVPTTVLEREKTVLTCSVNHSGNVLPELSWYRENERIKSDQTIETRQVTETLEFEALWEDDKLKFTCQMIFGAFRENCTRFLNVLYAVRNITIEPANKFYFYVKDEVKCSAHGNPQPKIFFGLSSMVQTKNSFRSKVISISKDWVEREISLNCSATNTLKLRSKTISRNITIRVSAKPEEKFRVAIEKAFDSPSAAIIGIVAIASVLLVLVFICVLIKRRKKSKRNIIVKKEPAHL